MIRRVDELRESAPGPRVSANDGGCWYCERETDDMSFTCEFDAYVHENCVKMALEDDPTDREAIFIGRELGLTGEEVTP